MAAKTGGIALLSMYNDEEDDEEFEGGVGGVDGSAVDGDPTDNGGAPPPEPTSDGTPPFLHPRTPLPSDEHSDHETLSSPIPQTPPPPSLPQPQIPGPSTLTSPPPPPPPSSLPEPLDAPRTRRGTLAIVDYAHDEAAMSPEPEEGEIVSSGQMMLGLEISEGNFDERTPPGTVHILTSSPQREPPQPSDLPEQSKSETSTAMDFTATETDVARVEVASAVSVDVRKDDPLNNFLPPPLPTKCPEELQEKINKFLAYKKAGKSFNADLRNRKDYRNPDFLQHAVRYQDIDQIGTCFSKDVFDPHGYDKSDYYDELEADMKREMEKKEQERKKSQKVDFVSGGTQPNAVAPALKMSTQIPAMGMSAAAVVASGLQTVSTGVDAIANKQNKKTKWDKVDGDAKNPSHSGGHDTLSTVGAHAVHLSAANAGSGYTAFAQQKRREAEEKRSSERKFERRS